MFDDEFFFFVSYGVKVFIISFSGFDSEIEGK